jgi:hypothetical protein
MVSKPKTYHIPAATAIEEGEVVLFTPGTGIAVVAGTDFDYPAIGVAAEAHDGATAGRQSGTEIKVYDDLGDVFEYVPNQKVITATGGSTTTFVDSNLKPATNDYFNGGYIQIVTCALDSSLIGKKVKISDYTGAGGTLHLAETLSAAIGVGDTAYLCPGKLAVTEFGWDLDSDGTDINWESDGGEAIQLVDADPDTFRTFWKLRLHQKAPHMLHI